MNERAGEPEQAGAAARGDGDRKGFLRLNYFLGQHLDVADFEVGERYHARKRRLHNRALHGYGVVPGQGQGLRVSGRRRGDLSLEVAPGMALDAEGNELVLAETAVRSVDTSKLKLPGVAYVVLRYADEPVDLVVNKANPRFKGHRRVQESALLELGAAPPGPDGGVELARVLLDDTVREVRDAGDPRSPGAGELDLRHVPRAGAAGDLLGVDASQRLEGLLATKRRLLNYLWTQHGIQSARDARAAVITAEMLAACRVLGPTELVRAFGLVSTLEAEVIGELREERPELVRREEVSDFEGEVTALRALTEAPRVDPGEFAAALSSLEETTGHLVRFFEEGPRDAPPRRRRARDEERRAAPPELPEEEKVSLEALAGLSELPERFVAEGARFRRVDTLDVMDRKSEAAHGFALHETEDEWNTRSEFYYPDGQKVTDAGRAHKGGFAEWRLLNLVPGKPVLLFKRVDYYYGEMSTEVLVDGQPAGTWEIKGSDRKHRWRNWAFLLAGERIAAEAVTLRQVADKAGRDVNLYRVWVYQAE